MSHKSVTTDPLGQSTATRSYNIDEKIYSLRESYKIKDKFDQPIFNVPSKLTFVDNLLLEDLAGKWVSILENLSVDVYEAKVKKFSGSYTFFHYF